MWVSKLYTVVGLFLLVLTKPHFSTAAESVQHYALVAQSFSPEDIGLEARRIEFDAFLKDLTQNPRWQVTEAEINPFMQNPATLVTHFLSQVEQKLEKKDTLFVQQSLSLKNDTASKNQMHPLQPLEITIYLRAHGSPEGYIYYFDRLSNKILTMAYEDLWAVVDHGAHRIESRFHIRPKLNIIIESCYSGSVQFSLQNRKWKSKGAKINILASSDVHEATYASSMHTLLDFAFSINSRLKNCKSCSPIEEAMKTASQIPLRIKTSGDKMNLQLYTVTRGRTLLFKNELKRFVGIMRAALSLSSSQLSQLRLTDSIFVPSKLDFFKKFKALLPVNHPAGVLYEPDSDYSLVELPSNVVHLNSAEKVWLHWEPKFRRPWPMDDAEKYAQALSWFIVQPETMSRATQLRSDLRSRSVELYSVSEGHVGVAVDVVADITHLLKAGRASEAISIIPRFLEDIVNSKETVYSKNFVEQWESEFFRAWALAANAGEFEFGQKEWLAFKNLQQRDQVWFREGFSKLSQKFLNKGLISAQALDQMRIFLSTESEVGLSKMTCEGLFRYK
jgi:hypothetical protein